jgi:hypothetical protein
MPSPPRPESTIMTKSDPTPLTEIMDMMTYRRPHGSDTEREFREKFLLPLGCVEDKYKNLIMTIGENPVVAWACHTDTVHRGSKQQRITLENGMIKLHKKSSSSCLGADCTAGVWLMMEMIRAKVPGLYIFHHAEEVGGLGANNIVLKTPELVAGIQSMISFDRYGTDSIITHQGGARTCSDAFGKSLAEQLIPGYKLDDGGTFTDSKVYRKLIPECTNISVGYYNQHSSRETQDVGFLMELRNYLVTIDPSKFVIERDPKVVEFSSWGGGKWGNGYGAGYSKYGLEGEDDGYGYGHGVGSTVQPFTLSEIVWTYPDDVIEVLKDAKVDLDAFGKLVLAERDRRREEEEQRKMRKPEATPLAVSA